MNPILIKGRADERGLHDRVISAVGLASVLSYSKIVPVSVQLRAPSRTQRAKGSRDAALERPVDAEDDLDSRMRRAKARLLCPPCFLDVFSETVRAVTPEEDHRFCGWLTVPKAQQRLGRGPTFVVAAQRPVEKGVLVDVVVEWLDVEQVVPFAALVYEALGDLDVHGTVTLATHVAPPAHE